MKLFSAKSAHSQIKKDNEELVGMNARLRKYFKDITDKLNTAKSDYEPDKIKALENFEKFTAELNIKKSKLLEEMNAIQREIDKKKDMYYGLAVKQDILDEKVYQIKLQEERLTMRETFVASLEQKFREKSNG